MSRDKRSHRTVTDESSQRRSTQKAHRLRRREFEDPTAVLQINNADEAEAVERPTGMPVESDRGGVNSDKESGSRRVDGDPWSSWQRWGRLELHCAKNERGGCGADCREGKLLFDDAVSVRGTTKNTQKKPVVGFPAIPVLVSRTRGRGKASSFPRTGRCHTVFLRSERVAQIFPKDGVLGDRLGQGFN